MRPNFDKMIVKFQCMILSRKLIRIQYKKGITSLSSYNTTSPQNENVEDKDNINYLLIIESRVTKNVKLDN